jgi:hypothetical protein
MKLSRMIRRFVQTCFSFSNLSHNNIPKGFYVLPNKINFIRIQSIARTEALYWLALLFGSIASALVRVPLSLLWEEYK